MSKKALVLEAIDQSINNSVRLFDVSESNSLCY